MKSSAFKRKRIIKIGKNDREAIILRLVTVLLGTAMSYSRLRFGHSPFGVGLVAGAPDELFIYAAAGGVIGAFLPSEYSGGFRIFTALLSVTLIRLILIRLKALKNTPVVSSVIAFTVTAGIGLAAVGSNVAKGDISFLADGLLASAGAYFIARCGSVKRSRGKNFEDTVSAVIFAAMILTSLYGIEIFGISIGRILTATLLLTVSRYSERGTAALSAPAAALLTVVAGGDIKVAVCLCFISFFATAFSSLGKIPEASVAVAVPSVWVLFSHAEAGSVSLLTEVFIGSVIFLFVPKTLSRKAAALLYSESDGGDKEGVRRTLVMRLGFASEALKGVTNTVDEVASCLSVAHRPAFSDVMTDIENDACRGCAFMLKCWETDKKPTVEAVLAMSDAVRHGRPIALAEVPTEFYERCLRRERFENALTLRYTEFLGNVAAEKRITEMRECMTDQMNGMSDMLGELAEEFRSSSRYDSALSVRLSAALCSVGACPEECCCFTDKYGRMTVEMRFRVSDGAPSRTKLLKVMEKTADRDFELPEIIKAKDGYYCTVSERSVFTVDCHFTQLIKGDNRLCGDTCRSFYDGRGRFTAVLSDGMGSGGRAAVDSALTAGLIERLLRSGFSYECVLKLVNSAMQYKSSDESTSTVDISCIDLFSGKTELLKAGAAPTIVRRSGRSGRAECNTLPIGVLHDIGFDRATVTLKEDDIIIMMSDGACADGTDWICREIEGFGIGSAKELSERIALTARRRRNDGHDDDITVFAAILGKAV